MGRAAQGNANPTRAHTQPHAHTLLSCSWLRWLWKMRSVVPMGRSNESSSWPEKMRKRAMVSFHSITAGSVAADLSMR
eukprot:355082-Chlamydomonas_euryale.AAC.2